MAAPRLVMVLGMHRSGTSAMARSLHVCGVDLGDKATLAHPCNPKGFFEDADLVAFNTDLLEQLGIGWDDASPIPPASLQALATGPSGAKALAFLRQKLEGRATFGMKDPRMCRLLGFWRPVLAAAQADVRCVIALRHPASVAHSLQQRDGMPAAQSHLLWLAHMLDTISGTTGLPRLVLDYDALLAEPVRQIRRLAHFLALPVNEDALAEFANDFLDKGLCHHSTDGQEKPATNGEDMAVKLHAQMGGMAREATGSSLDEPRFQRQLAKLREGLQSAVRQGNASA